MPVIRFPRPATSEASYAGLENYARTIALSVRFKGRPVDAVRWSRTVSAVEVDAALAADDVLLLIDTKRAIREAAKAGDQQTAMRLQAFAARLHTSIHEIGRRHRIAGWRQAR